MTATVHTDPRHTPLAAAGVRYIIRDHLAAVMALGLALGAARTLGWYNAWLLYGGLVIVVKLGSAIILVRMNPAVLNARGTKQAMSTRDRLFFSVFIPMSLAVPIVGGLEAGIAGWSHRSFVELVAGLGLCCAGSGLIVWALAVNAFFEPTVRIQDDRGHTVCTSGPYRFVRHPGYTGVILAGFGVPFALGSRWALVPVIITAVAFVVRITYEDEMLHDELPGYRNYAATTRWRLLPFVW